MQLGPCWSQGGTGRGEMSNKAIQAPPKASMKAIRNLNRTRVDGTAGRYPVFKTTVRSSMPNWNAITLAVATSRC